MKRQVTIWLAIASILCLGRAYLSAAPWQDDYDAKLIKVGKKAPAFTLPAPHGGTISLAGAASGKKAVLINFWFYG